MQGATVADLQVGPAMIATGLSQTRRRFDDQRLRAIIETHVAAVFGVPCDELAALTRGRARVALARQIAMYIGHVACRQSLTDVGRAFGRDRTTVAHACGVVEDRRDEPQFDRTLELLERIVVARIEPRAVLFAAGGA